MSVKPITALAANKLGKLLTKDFRRIFGPAHDEVAERLGSFARSTIECLGRSDALYHNFEHTLQVTMVGRDILQGMTLSQRIEPEDYCHLIVACLLHDIGYMRGVLSGDTEDEVVVDGKGRRITYPVAHHALSRRSLEAVRVRAPWKFTKHQRFTYCRGD
jgi:hypothetical protein